MTTAFQRRYFAGGGTTTTLANAMSASDTSFSVNSATGWPGSPGSSFIVVIDRGTSSEEKILCASNSSTTVTVSSSGRGYDGTSATTHNASATVSLCGGAVDLDEANQLTNLMGNGAEGSLFYGKGTGALPAKLSVGSANQQLLSNGTDPEWAASATSTLSTTGDMLYASSANSLARLAIGSSTQVLQSSGSAPEWETPTNGYGITGFAAAPMVPAVDLTTAQSYITSGSGAVSLGTSATNITSVSLGAGTWLILAGASCFNPDTNHASQGDIWIGPNSASATGLYVAKQVGLPEAGLSGTSSYGSVEMAYVETLGSTTTVYLQGASSNGAMSAGPYGINVTTATTTGITAVRVA